MGCTSCGLPNEACGCESSVGEPCGDSSDPCGDRSKFQQLTALQARTTTAQRLSKVMDRANQRMVQLGFRPYNVDLVWSRWTGGERGAGFEEPFKRVAITPSPIVTDLSNIALSPVATGILPMGSLKLDRIGVCYTSDELMGRLTGEPGTPEPFDFYIEVREDGRSGTGDRMKFRPSTTPHRGLYGWSMSIERISADAARDGTLPGAEVPP